jgi:hypothetical protein
VERKPHCLSYLRRTATETPRAGLVVLLLSRLFLALILLSSSLLIVLILHPLRISPSLSDPQWSRLHAATPHRRDVLGGASHHSLKARALDDEAPRGVFFKLIGVGNAAMW